MNWFNLLIDWTPWWVWVVAAIVVLAFTFQFWYPIWAILPKWLKGTILGAAALFTVFNIGRNRGSKDEQEARDKANANAIKDRTEIDHEVQDLPSADVDKRLDKWMRD